MGTTWTILVAKPKTCSWSTPREVYDALDAEFHFDYDPCPLGAEGGLFGVHDGLLSSWSGRRVFCNPPYGPDVGDWLRRAKETAVAVYLLPARTDSKWWSIYAPMATEVRFIRGRLKFGTAKNSAPFASAILVFRNE